MRWNRVPIITFIMIILMAAASMSGCTSPTTTNNSSSTLKAGLSDTMDFSIQITGGTTSPVTVTYADMKAMDFKELDNISTVNSVGTVTVGDYIGVPMMSIIGKAGIPDGDLSFKIAAVDGYNLVYTRDQMDRAILAFKKNGTPLIPNVNSNLNSIRIVVPNETNNMWLKMPAQIEITKGATAQPVLSITGMIDSKRYLSHDDIKALPQVNGTFVDRNNSTINVTGFALNPMLDSLSIQGNATAVVFTGSDGYNKTVNLTDVRKDSTAMIAVDGNGTLKDYGSRLPMDAWVGNLTSIKVV